MTIIVCRVSGEPWDRGNQLGGASAQQVTASLELYERVFAKYSALTWKDAKEKALPYIDLIAKFNNDLLEEMDGLANGSGLEFEDILTINVRSEVMFSGLAQKSQAASEFRPRFPVECSVVALTPLVTSDDRTLLAQNWDWLHPAKSTVVVAIVERDDGPNYLSIAEAGLLAKMGFNEAGLGVVTNALVTSADGGVKGLPYHMLLREALNGQTVEEALERIRGLPRAGSSHILAGSADGLLASLELGPGGIDTAWMLEPQKGVALHTNHFLHPRFDGEDILDKYHLDSRLRLQSLWLDHEGKSGFDIQSIKEALRSHRGKPRSVCHHLPSSGSDPLVDVETIVSVIMDLKNLTAHIALGQPCCTPYESVCLGTDAGLGDI